MRAIEIGRRMAELGQREDAVRAYHLALEREWDQCSALERMEAAVFLLETGEVRAACQGFLSLYGEGDFQEDVLSILTGALYEPNVKDQRLQYQRNVKRLRRYPYLFRKDFPEFEDLPVRFFPCDDGVYAPFDTRTGAFGEMVEPGYQEITRNFFRDLERPVLAKEVYSQYELEYLNDNVRRSEDVGRENHLYLHYEDWGVFCSWLQLWDLRPLIQSEKAVFLFGDELSRYPIDFAREYGMDYSRFPVRPVSIREVTRLIWHTQLSFHNGGDFFNEIFDSHPNLLFISSIWLKTVQQEVTDIRKGMRLARSLKDAQRELFDHWDPALVAELYHMNNPTDKDIMVAMYMGARNWSVGRDPAARIAPAVFFQPHMPITNYHLSINRQGETVAEAREVREIEESSLFRGFKYIKAFTPMRRFTTSFGASMRFLKKNAADTLEKYRGGETGKEAAPAAAGFLSAAAGTPFGDDNRKTIKYVSDILGDKTRNRSFMVDPESRLFRDSVIVRFEDAKLNPKATFTALAAFLDLPYTESMTYCSTMGERDPVPYWGQDGSTAVGFSLKSVYETYEQFAGHSERLYLEYLLRDAYQYYGYDFQNYDGSAVDEAEWESWIGSMDVMEDNFRQIQWMYYDIFCLENPDSGLVSTEEQRQEHWRGIQERIRADLRQTALAMTAGLRYVNRNGVPLRMGRLLQPDPALMEHPLYR